MSELVQTTSIRRDEVFFSHKTLLILAVAASCGLAYAIPYDVVFDRLTLNSATGRALAMLALWGAGLWLQRANGFSLAVVRLRRPVLTIAALALAVAIWCAVIDWLVFPSMLPPSYHQLEQQSLGLRLLYFCSRAVNENVLYRLFLGSLLAWILRKAFARPRYALLVSMLGMALAHVINIAANMGFVGHSPGMLAWLFLRFVIPGLIWGWLYVRHGFAANEAAAVSVHWFLQPIASFASSAP